MAILTQHNWLYFITDIMGRSRWVDNSGLTPEVKISSPPVPLPQRAKGWEEMKISFGTSDKYWNLQRSFSINMFFVGDGATICRDAMYNKKGYEEELFLVVMKLNPATGVHELEYKGRLDFSKAKDEPRKGITVPTIEGGVLTYISANEGVFYELPLTIRNSACKQIYFDGTNLYDRLRYSTLGIEIKATPTANTYIVLPMPFIANEGDSVGIVNGSQEIDWTDNFNTYVASSNNCILYSIKPITVTITGNIKFTVKQDNYPTGDVGVFFITSSHTGAVTDFEFHRQDIPAQQDFNIPINKTISLAANEKLFLMISLIGNLANHLTYVSQPGDLYFSFNTINPPSYAWSMPIIDVLKQTVERMTTDPGTTMPKYTANSNFFSAHKNIVYTSTNAIQNFGLTYYYGKFQTTAVGLQYQIIVPGTLTMLPSENQLEISGAPCNNGVYTIINTSPLIGGFTTITVVEPLINSTVSGKISAVASLKISFQDLFTDLDCLYNVGMKIVNDVIWIEPKKDLYNINTQPTLPKPTAATAAGGSLTVGSYSIIITLVTDDGREIAYSIASDVVTLDLVNKIINISNIPIGIDLYANIVARKIYRQLNSGSYFLVATINDNTTTTYNLSADTDIGAALDTTKFGIFDLGEIADLKIRFADELLVNSVKIGYKSQDYRQRNGIYEYNTTTQFKLPVNSIRKEYTKILKARGDCFGIEFIRSNVFNKPTTDITGDNLPFVVNTKEGDNVINTTVNFVASGNVIELPTGIVVHIGDILRFSGSTSNDADYTIDNIYGFLFSEIASSLAAPTVVLAAGGTLPIGTYSYIVSYMTASNVEVAYSAISAATTTTGGNQTINLSTIPTSSDPQVVARNLYISPDGLNFYFLATINDNTTTTFSNTTYPPLFIKLVVSGRTIVDEAGAAVSLIINPDRSLILNRVNYDNITGVLDNTVYNIEEMTPHRLLKAHGNYLRGLLYFIQNLKILFQTADKNSALSTTLAGITLAERQDETVSGLDDILFLPFKASFTTRVPMTFATLFTNITVGYIKGTFYGYPLYFLPIGKMDSQPATNAAQNWELILAPNNDMEVIKKLSLEQIFQ